MFLVYSQSCTIVSQNSRTFLPAQRDCIPVNSHFPVSLLQTTTNQIPIPMDLPTVDVLYKWNHTRSGLQCLASFTQNNAFKFQSYSFFLQPNNILFLDMLHFAYPFIRTFKLFPLFSYYEY